MDEDCWSLVFECLDGKGILCARIVCKEWQVRADRSARPWRSVDLVPQNEEPGEFEEILRACRSPVSRVRLSMVVDLTPELARLLSLRPRLRSVSLADVETDDAAEVLSAIAQECPWLTRFDLTGYPVSFESLAAVSRHCDVEEAILDRALPRGPSRHSEADGEMRGQSLRRLSLANDPNWLDTTLLRGLAAVTPGLTSLNLAGSIGEFVVLGDALECWGQLSSLDVSECVGVDGFVLIDFPRVPLLRELRVNTCKNLDQRALDLITRACSLLEVLSVANNEWVTDEGLDLLPERCPHLRELDVSYCVSITPACFVTVGKCPRMEILRMNHLSMSWESAPERLAPLTQLRELWACYNRWEMSIDFLRRMRDALPRLRRFIIRGGATSIATVAGAAEELGSRIECGPDVQKPCM